MRAEDDAVISQRELVEAEERAWRCRGARNRAIAKLRAAGWTLHRIADLIGVSHVAIHYILTRERRYPSDV